MLLSSIKNDRFHHRWDKFNRRGLVAYKYLRYGKFSATAFYITVSVFKALWVFQFLPIYSYLNVAQEKIPQRTGNGSRKSHVILRIFMQPGPGSFNMVVLTERLEL